MTKRNLTAAAVEKIKPPTSGQEDHFDAGYPGLALRVSYGGGKAWTFFYRLRGKQARLTLGRFPAMTLAEAREAWRNAREMVAKGEPPRPKPPVDSFDMIAEDWLKRDQADNRTVDEVRRFIERDVKPHWTGRPFATLSKRDALDLVDAIADRGAVTLARRAHAHLHRMFKWSVGRGIIESNPMADTPKPGNGVSRDRVLSDEELRAAWKAAGATPWPFGPMFQLLILTGARRDEIGSLRWSEIDGDVIRLSGERTKNGQPHDIPLAPEAMAIIAALPRMDGSEFVFTTSAGREESLGGEKSISGFSRAKGLLDAAMLDELYDEQAGHAWLPAWRLHDLRRTAATGMQRLGIGLQVVEDVLGHVSGSRAGVVGVYQRYGYEKEKRIALEAWARDVVGQDLGEVVPLMRPKV